MNELKDYYVMKDDSETFSLNQCRNCMVKFTLPFMTNDDLSRYYPKTYEAFVEKKTLISRLQTIKYKADIRNIKKNLLMQKKGYTLYEVGSGRGEFLMNAKKRGFKVTGSEPSENGIKIAKSVYGIYLDKEYLDNLVFKSHYDVVVVRHVIEHVNEPLRCLRNIYENALEENGVLFIKMPRFDTWEFNFFKKFTWMDIPRHRTHFEKTGMRKLLKDIGFRKIKIKSEVVPTGVLYSLEFLSVYGARGIKKRLSIIFNSFPYVLKFSIALLACQIMRFWGPSRMVIIAKK
jgi:SAM-dependent methyltransferase